MLSGANLAAQSGNIKTQPGRRLLVKFPRQKMKSCLRLFASDKITVVGITSHPVITYVQCLGLQATVFLCSCPFKHTGVPTVKCDL